MKKSTLIAIFVCLAIAVAAVRFLRSSPLNDWEMRNLPVRDGGILCFGDSLVAGVGAGKQTDTYPAQLGNLLGQKVMALGKSGQTAEEGFQMVRQRQDLRPAVAIVTLGGNDILRRVPLEQTLEALGGIFAEFQSRGSVVVFTAVEGLIGGKRREAYRDLCREHGVILVENILGGILSNEDLKSDQIHPNGAGYRIMAERIDSVMKPFLRKQP